LLELTLYQGRLAVIPPASALSSFLCLLLNLLHLLLKFFELLLQAYLLPFSIGAGSSEVGTLWSVGTTITYSQATEICITKLLLLAAHGVIITLGAPAIGGGLYLVDLILDAALFESGAETRRDGARNAVAFVAVGKHVEKSKTLIFANSWVAARVDEIPGTAHVRVGDI